LRGPAGLELKLTMPSGDIGRAAHVRRAMPAFLTLRDGEGKALATAMLPRAGRDSLAPNPIVVGPGNDTAWQAARRLRGGPDRLRLYRLVTALGHGCTVVAPSLIPHQPGGRSAPGLPEAVWRESGRRGRLLVSGTAARFRLGRRHVADRLEQSGFQQGERRS
jgi:hypothetical protein